MFLEISCFRQALILDFDGVVIDTEQLQFESWNAAFDELLGIRLTGNHRQLVGLNLDGIYSLWCQDSVVLSAEMKERLLACKTEWYFNLAAGRLTLMPGLVNLVHRARALGWYVMIASRGRRMRLLQTLEMVGQPLAFDLVMGSEDIVEPVTDCKNHARVAQPFGIDPACCLVIEDSASGVRDARACGIGHVIGLTSSLDRATLLAAGAHTIVEHLDQIQLKANPDE